LKAGLPTPSLSPLTIIHFFKEFRNKTLENNSKIDEKEELEDVAQVHGINPIKAIQMKRLDSSHFDVMIIPLSPPLLLHLSSPLFLQILMMIKYDSCDN